METNKVFCAGLTGLATGIFLGLAFAPRSGRETQALLRQRTREGLDQLAAGGKKAGAQLQDIAGKGQDLAARGKERLTDAVAAGQQAYNKAAARG